MPNVAIPDHPLIGTRHTYRPDLPDATHLPAGEYVARNGDEVEVLAVFNDWNEVPGLTIFHVAIPATGHTSHFSERELGLKPYDEVTP